MFDRILFRVGVVVAFASLLIIATTFVDYVSAKVVADLSHFEWLRGL